MKPLTSLSPFLSRKGGKRGGVILPLTSFSLFFSFPFKEREETEGEWLPLTSLSPSSSFPGKEEKRREEDGLPPLPVPLKERQGEGGGHSSHLTPSFLFLARSGKGEGGGLSSNLTLSFPSLSRKRKN